MGAVDLHLHTTVSDGILTPTALVRRAVERGLEYIAVTDHDSVDGVREALVAAAAYPDLTCIPGIEISTEVETGEAHLLGYFVDYRDAALNRRMHRIQRSRERRAEDMVAKLNDLGLKLEITRVRELAGEGSVGRPHVAAAMLEKGYIVEFAEAFEKYIGRGGPAYVSSSSAAAKAPYAPGPNNTNLTSFGISCSPRNSIAVEIAIRAAWSSG